VQGTAALLGLATGTAVGVAYALADTLLGGTLRRRPLAVSGLVVTAGALVAANGPMTILGVTDPRHWTGSGWATDLLPHLACGLVTAYTYAATEDPSR